MSQLRLVDELEVSRARMEERRIKRGRKEGTKGIDQPACIAINLGLSNLLLEVLNAHLY